MPQHTAVGNNASDGMVRPVHPTLPHHCPPAARPCEAPRPVPQRGAREPSRGPPLPCSADSIHSRTPLRFHLHWRPSSSFSLAVNNKTDSE